MVKFSELPIFKVIVIVSMRLIRQQKIEAFLKHYI